MKSIKNIGIIGGAVDNQLWVSVDKVRYFFISVLSKYYNIIYLDDNSEQMFNDLDLILNFRGKTGWKRPKSINCPILLCIHGGAIIDQEFLLQYLPNLTNKDGLIVTCLSDIDIVNNICNTVKPNLCLLPLAYDNKRFYRINKKIAKSIFDINDDFLCLGFVARLLPQKNAHIFIRIVDEIKKRVNKKIRMIIIGNYWMDYPVLDYISNEYIDYIPNLISELNLKDEVVFLPGNLKDEELLVAYNAMDFLIHPTNSLDENFGLVPIEAMACGTPVIGAAYGGLKDTITSDIGLTFPTWITDNGIRMDSKMAIEEIVSLISNPKLYKIKSKDCLARVKDLFMYKHFSDRLRNHIDSLIRNYKIGDNKKVNIHSVEKVEFTDELPPTKGGTKWLQYYGVVSKYVSLNSPIFDNNSEVYLDVPLKISKDGKFEREDPAWPAVYKLNVEESKIIEYCLNMPLTYCDCLSNEFNTTTVQSLINRGVIVITKKSING